MVESTGFVTQRRKPTQVRILSPAQDGDVAQLVEQRIIHVLPRVRNQQQYLNSTVNPLVCGSSPHVTANWLYSSNGKTSLWYGLVVSSILSGASYGKGKVLCMLPYKRKRRC